MTTEFKRVWKDFKKTPEYATPKTPKTLTTPEAAPAEKLEKAPLGHPQNPQKVEGDSFGGFGGSILADILKKAPDVERAARALLAHYQDEGAASRATWLERFDQAHLDATLKNLRFNPNYRRRFVEVAESNAQIAAHTIATALWATDDTEVPHGAFLEAACRACGVDVAHLPESKGAAA